MPQVFLSRSLRASSPFNQLLSQPDWEIMARSLLEFKGLAFDELPVADWLFFYSGKGVQFFLQQMDLPAGLKIATIGRATARQLEARGRSVDFIGDGSPAAVAIAFLAVAARQRVLFVQARRSRRSIQSILGSKIEGIDLIVYDNVPQPTILPVEADYLLFTSPLNFETYRQCNRINLKQRLIGIGPTTAGAFQLAGLDNYRMAKRPTESALLECLLKWQQEYPL